MRKIIFIRHMATTGNLEKRYIGRTDESIISIPEKSYPKADMIYVSPMKRCIETAEAIYPNQKYNIIDDFRECDFGKFEGKNYFDLNGDPDYQKWIDSDGTLPFPDGEDHISFKNRCIEAFRNVIESDMNETIACVIHGGTIMAVLEHYSEPKSTFYDWHISNGDGYITEFKNNKLYAVEKI